MLLCRNVVFEVVSEKAKKWFGGGEGGVEEISVTLDKVTIQRKSFTVLLTYFFSNGVIYIFLNKLMQMLVDEYDSVGFARAVVRDLCETLGVTKTRLAVILLHFAYDGVYATTQQRVDGGGSLNLIHHVTSELGLEEGDISGA